jgi:predicted metal-binding protein
MMEFQNDLEVLCKFAKDLGATNAKPFNAKDVVIDQRVKMKCQVPPCKDYGKNLMCPPYVMNINEFRDVLSKYEWALLIQVEAPFNTEVKNEISQTGDVGSLYKNKEFLMAFGQNFGSNFNLLHLIINKVEAKASMLGYRFATGFKAGACKLCPECVAENSGKHCRHPYQARPSMEAVGIDVLKTAEIAGLPVDFPPKDKAVWNGLVLIN